MASESATKKDQPKIKVYWLNDSRAQRVLWLLEELHLDYELEIFYRNKDMLAPPDLAKVHPLGKSPVVTLTYPSNYPTTTTMQPDKTIVLAESGFIFQYLTEHFGNDTNLLPKRYPDDAEGVVGAETEAWMRYQYYLHYTEGSFQPALLVALVLNILKGPQIPFLIRPITGFVASKFYDNFVTPYIANHLSFIQSQLESAPDGGPYLCGKHLTAADILLNFPLGLVHDRLGDIKLNGEKVVDKYPKVWEYLQRLQGHDGYKRAEKRIEEVEARNKK
ncbi:hypothetical protein B0H66DRAFT_565939 [Apodospora peruviana]|uniref:glutathione transferase n=1 Tax=Apodospora peruviana TaxID=516989 RepID=A0AAE0HVH5_9PEZI|nr:hypothetical protein B0H66DRAFT_565939 [Apodospora peruviana]